MTSNKTKSISRKCSKWRKGRLYFHWKQYRKLLFFMKCIELDPICKFRIWNQNKNWSIFKINLFQTPEVFKYITFLTEKSLNPIWLYRITSDRLAQLAELTAAVFPKFSKSTFYLPSEKGLNARGMFQSFYANHRRDLILMNLLKTRTAPKKQSTVDVTWCYSHLLFGKSRNKQQNQKQAKLGYLRRKWFQTPSFII